MLRQILLDWKRRGTVEAEAAGQPGAIHVHDRGCYVCMEGPAFSTRAESLMHRLWGGDLIGMTAMPEAKLAREAEMSYALVALVTDYDCWRRRRRARRVPAAAAATRSRRSDPDVLLKEIIANLQAASDNAIALIRRAVARMAERRGRAGSPPRRGRRCELAIWSDKTRIPREEVERLGPLWMKYFEDGEPGMPELPDSGFSSDHPPTYVAVYALLIRGPRSAASRPA